MKCTFLVHSMTHENVIQDPLYSVIGLLEQWWWEKGSQNEFLLCSAWRAPGGHVWLPPKSLVLPPKSIMPFVKQEVFRQLIQWHVGVKPENESPWNAVPSPKKKKRKRKGLCGYILSYRPAAKQFLPLAAHLRRCKQQPVREWWKGFAMKMYVNPDELKAVFSFSDDVSSPFILSVRSRLICSCNVDLAQKKAFSSETSISNKLSVLQEYSLF